MKDKRQDKKENCCRCVVDVIAVEEQVPEFLCLGIPCINILAQGARFDTTEIVSHRHGKSKGSGVLAVDVVQQRAKQSPRLLWRGVCLSLALVAKPVPIWDVLQRRIQAAEVKGARASLATQKAAGTVADSADIFVFLDSSVNHLYLAERPPNTRNGVSEVWEGGTYRDFL